MRFKSRPAEIEAECFITGKPLPFRDERACCYDGHNWYVEARGRRIVIDPGDWVIREPDGKGFYPCKPDIFVARWEPIEPKDGDSC